MFDNIKFYFSKHDYKHTSDTYLPVYDCCNCDKRLVLSHVDMRRLPKDRGYFCKGNGGDVILRVFIKEWWLPFLVLSAFILFIGAGTLEILTGRYDWTEYGYFIIYVLIVGAFIWGINRTF